MPLKGYSYIAIKEQTKKELVKHKMNKQAKLGKPITWDEFLLEQMNKHRKGNPARDSKPGQESPNVTPQKEL